MYNFALPPLVFHTLRTGDATRLRRWGQALELPSDRVTFFNFLASHDGIGLNPAKGILDESEIAGLAQTALDHNGFVSYKHNADGTTSPYELNINYFDALSNPLGDEPAAVQVGRFLCAHAIMLLRCAACPAIYFHSLFGSRGDRAGAETSGIPRRINRKKLQGKLVEELAAELDDPGQPALSSCIPGLGGIVARPPTSHAFRWSLCHAENSDAPEGLFVIERGIAGSGRALCAHERNPGEVGGALEG